MSKFEKSVAKDALMYLRCLENLREAHTNADAVEAILVSKLDTVPGYSDTMKTFWNMTTNEPNVDAMTKAANSRHTARNLIFAGAVGAYLIYATGNQKVVKEKLEGVVDDVQEMLRMVYL